ncbi:DNA/RNA-binding protein Alba-like protein [Corchorus capsularis]|uniref:DNA/RNA-binding protein Alba-like protein n=1 Tax=Corchorus capsularis TaxID=210143 RepID=A0A1R3K7X6_COCAP|nr:DNA/RNA-binding protein Alba-like protein [Corchorus capsularis]
MALQHGVSRVSRSPNFNTIHRIIHSFQAGFLSRPRPADLIPRFSESLPPSLAQSIPAPPFPAMPFNVLSLEKESYEIVLQAMGRAINKTVMIAERRIADLHQNISIGSSDITDMCVETTRHVTMITITLSLKDLNTYVCQCKTEPCSWSLFSAIAVGVMSNSLFQSLFSMNFGDGSSMRLGQGSASSTVLSPSCF